jgi:hypothetical protein
MARNRAPRTLVETVSTLKPGGTFSGKGSFCGKAAAASAAAAGKRRKSLARRKVLHTISVTRKGYEQPRTHGN